VETVTVWVEEAAAARGAPISSGVWDRVRETTDFGGEHFK
jgi:hypothetical protein